MIRYILTEIEEFAKFITPAVLVMTSLVVTGLVSVPVAWVFKLWALYWFPNWF